ncbi:hypothetical protein [Methylibium sp. T29]|uniref:hypothetical protein n=1 Tax=Methylibium sp. T29 TaxID=1430884 RepID=UPI001378CB26|nr:hypothetical protein [Methylibium sp. T29]
MSDERLIRLELLKQVMKDRKINGPSGLLDACGYSTYPYWRDLLAGIKTFGEKAARRIEDSLEPKLPRGYLDGISTTAAPSPIDQPLLPLREREPDLLIAYRLLDPPVQDELLEHVRDLVAAHHRPTFELMKRLKVSQRADSDSVNDTFQRANEKFPRKRTPAAAKTAKTDRKIK